MVNLILHKLIIIEKKVNSIMSYMDDLNAAVSKVSEDIKAAVAKLQTNDAAAVESAVSVLNQADASLQAVLSPVTPAPTA